MKRSISILLAGIVMLMTVSCTDKKAQVAKSINEFTNFELGTVEYIVTKAVAADDRHMISDSIDFSIGDRKILYSMTASLKAGLNLDSFNPETDIVIDDKSIKVSFPKAELLVLNIAPESIKYEFSKVSWYRFNFTETDKNKLLAMGEASIRETVPNLGILKDAEKNAKDFFESLLAKMGFTSVEINFK